MLVLCSPAQNRHWPTPATQNICITFVQCWTTVEDVGPTLYKCYTNVLCLLGSASSQRAQGICAALVQHRPSVFDAGPALYRCCADVLSLLGYDVITFNEHINYIDCIDYFINMSLGKVLWRYRIKARQFHPSKVIETRNDFYFSSNSKVWTLTFATFCAFFIFLTFLNFFTIFDFFWLFDFLLLFDFFFTFFYFFFNFRLFWLLWLFFTFLTFSDFFWLFFTFVTFLTFFDFF